MSKINIKKIILILLLILYASNIAKASDADLIEGMCKEGGVVKLEARTYTFDRSITLKSGNLTLQGDNTVFKFADECGIPQNIPMISGTGLKNITFSGIQFEGNQDRQTYALKYSNPNHPEQSHKKAYGNQVGTFIYLINCQNIKVTRCAFNDNLGDGLRCSGCKDIEVSYCTGEKGGHDTLFFLRSSYVSVHNNNIKARVNSACRLLSTSHVRIYSNVFTWEDQNDSGPLYQAQNDKGEMEDVEVCGNIFKHSCGPGAWLVDKTGGNSKIWIHDNLFLDCGDNKISWVSGIVSSGYNNELIENNVFDGCYRASILYLAVQPAWATEAKAEIKANVFTNAKKGQLDGKGPYGVENTISKQDVVLSENCFYNNQGGNTAGCKLSDSDIFLDPKTEKTPSGWTWDGKEWSCPEVKPSAMDVPQGFEPISDQDIEDANKAADEFDVISNLLNLEYTETAKTSYTATNFNPKSIWTERGKVAVKFKILGWNNLFIYNNQSYVSSPEDIIVQTEVIKNPTLADWFGGISKTKKTVSVEMANGTAKATLHVSVKWYNFERDKTTGAKMKGQMHVSNYTFTDSCPAPNIYQEPETFHGKIYQYPNHFEMKVFPENNLVTSIEYKLNENTSKLIYLIGIKNKTETGIKITDYENLEYWQDVKGNISHQGSWIIENGEYDPEIVNVTVHGPYKDHPVKFEIIEKELNEPLFKWWLSPYMIILLFFVSGYGYIYYHVKRR